ncbi:hypothetical protein [Lactococcus lactis]
MIILLKKVGYLATIFKKETLYNNHYATLEDYIQDVIEWIQVYNTAGIRL